MKARIYTPKLVEGTEDQYKIYTDNHGTMLCGDLLDEEFIRIYDIEIALESCEGNLDLFKFKLFGK